MAPMGDAEENTVQSTPPYVHGLLDAFLTRRPLDFAGVDVPPDVQARLEGAVATGKLGTVPHPRGKYTFGEQAPRPLTVDRDTVERFLAEVGVAVDKRQRLILREVLITPAGLRATYLRRGESGGFFAFGDDAMATEVVDVPFPRKPRRDANEVPPRPTPNEYGSLPVLDIDKLRDAAP